MLGKGGGGFGYAEPCVALSASEGVRFGYNVEHVDGSAVQNQFLSGFLPVFSIFMVILLTLPILMILRKTFEKSCFFPVTIQRIVGTPSSEKHDNGEMDLTGTESIIMVYH